MKYQFVLLRRDCKYNSEDFIPNLVMVDWKVGNMEVNKYNLTYGSIEYVRYDSVISYFILSNFFQKPIVSWEWC